MYVMKFNIHVYAERERRYAKMADETLSVSDCVKSAEVMLKEARKRQFHEKWAEAPTFATLSTAYSTLALAKIEARREKEGSRFREV